MARDRQSVVASIVDGIHGNDRGGGSGDDAGDCADAFKQQFVEVAALRIVIANLAGIHRKRQDMRRIEAQIGMRRLGKASCKQARDDKQHQRTAHL